VAQGPGGACAGGKGWIQYDNPYDVGMTGLLGYGACYEAMHACDLLVLLGTGFPDVQFMPTEAKVVQVDLRRERLGSRSRLDLGVWGDVKETLGALVGRVAEKPDRTVLDQMLVATVSWGGGCGPTPRRWVASGRSIPSTSPRPGRAGRRRRRLHRRHRHVYRVGGPVHQRHRPAPDAGLLVHGSMANALPQAIGAWLPDRGRQVIAMSGDADQPANSTQPPDNAGRDHLSWRTAHRQLRAEASARHLDLGEYLAVSLDPRSGPRPGAGSRRAARHGRRCPGRRSCPSGPPHDQGLAIWSIPAPRDSAG
jgi:hypothetical protein